MERNPMERKSHRRRFVGKAVIATTVAAMNVIFPLNTIILRTVAIQETTVLTNTCTTNNVINSDTNLITSIAKTSVATTSPTLLASTVANTTTQKYLYTNATPTTSPAIDDTADNQYTTRIYLPQTDDYNSSGSGKSETSKYMNENNMYSPFVTQENTEKFITLPNVQAMRDNLMKQIQKISVTPITSDEINKLVEEILKAQTQETTKSTPNRISTTSTTANVSDNDFTTDTDANSISIDEVADNYEVYISEDISNNVISASEVPESCAEEAPTISIPDVSDEDDYIDNSSDTEIIETNSSWDGPVLTAYAGTVQGPSGKETYYNLDMSGVISIMRSYGYDGEYWIRDDGVKMLGDYIMCAANLDLRPRGSLVETSLGTAIVCDTGGFAYNNAYQIDIAVTW